MCSACSEGLHFSAFHYYGIYSHLLSRYSLGISDDEALSLLSSLSPALHDWCNRFLQPHPTPDLGEIEFKRFFHIAAAYQCTNAKFLLHARLTCVYTYIVRQRIRDICTRQKPEGSCVVAFGAQRWSMEW